MSFNDCGYALNVTLNGSMTFSISGNTNNYSASVSYNNFSLNDGTNVISLNASMSITGSYVDPVETVSVSMPMAEMTMNSDYVNMYNYSSTQTYNYNTSAYTIDEDYTFESSFINGAVHVGTEQQIQGYDYNPYPNSGAVVITGANNSHVRVSTNGTGQATDLVTVEIDADGDDVYESFSNLAWSEFDLLSYLN
jgi:hypothetical protein